MTNAVELDETMVENEGVIHDVVEADDEVEIEEVADKETELQTSVYAVKSVSDDEKKSAKDLGVSFRSFLKKSYSIDICDPISGTVPSGIDVLDTILGGGFATGLTMIVSASGAGKSTLAAKIISTCQKKYAGKMITVYADSEEAMTKDRLSELGVRYPEEEPITDITVEKIFKIVDGICAFKEEHPELIDLPSIIVWDSIANTLTEKGELEDDMNKVMGEKARLLAFALPKYVKKLNKFKICLIAINQLRDKINIGNMPKAPDLKWLNDKKIPGGNSVIYNTKQIIFLKPSSDIKPDELGFNGMFIDGFTIKNKLFTPHIAFSLVFSFEKGFSNFWSNWNMLKDFKRIVVSGGWCRIIDIPDMKFRQKEAASLYINNPAFRDAFDNNVKDVLQNEYFKPYKSGSRNDSLVD
jgi:RecA/RadA recombinase